MTRPVSEARQDWVDTAKAVPVLEVAQRLGIALRRAGQEQVGPCPIHPTPKGGKSDTFGVNPVRNVWICRQGGAGGDGIALVQHVEGCEFLAAVEILAGPPPDGPAETEAQREARRAERARRESEAAARAEKQERDGAHFRELERLRAHDIWRTSDPLGALGETYLAHRGLLVPPGVRLRERPAHRYYVLEHGKPPRLVWTGPALIAPLIGPDGRFAGVHATWLDPRLGTAEMPREDKGTAEVVDPKTGEVLASKKVRGVAKGAAIELVRAAEPRRLLLGEGIETTLSVWAALFEAGSDWLEGAAVWAAISIGNLCGGATGHVAHPTARIIRHMADGRELDGGPCKVPGPVPDLGSGCVTIPDSVEELMILGDGDSEPFFTAMALERAARRHSVRADGRERRVKIVPARPGHDWNDLRRAALRRGREASGEMEQAA